MSAAYDGPRVVDNVAAEYSALRRRKIVGLLGRWVSGVDPMLVEQIDVSPQILARFGLTHAEAVPPQFVDEMHWLELIDAGR